MSAESEKFTGIDFVWLIMFGLGGLTFFFGLGLLITSGRPKPPVITEQDISMHLMPTKTSMVIVAAMLALVLFELVDLLNRYILKNLARLSLRFLLPRSFREKLEKLEFVKSEGGKTPPSLMGGIRLARRSFYFVVVALFMLYMAFFRSASLVWIAQNFRGRRDPLGLGRLIAQNLPMFPIITTAIFGLLMLLVAFIVFIAAIGTEIIPAIQWHSSTARLFFQEEAIGESDFGDLVEMREKDQAKYGLFIAWFLFLFRLCIRTSYKSFFDRIARLCITLILKPESKH